MSLTLIPGEVPRLKLGFCNLEEGRSTLGSNPLLCHGESEVRVWYTSIGFGSIDWSVDLKPYIEVLARKKVDPFIRRKIRHVEPVWKHCDLLIRGEDTSKGRASTKSLESLSDGRRHQ